MQISRNEQWGQRLATLAFVWPKRESKNSEFLWQQPERQPFVCQQLDEKLYQTTCFCCVKNSAPNQTNLQPASYYRTALLLAVGIRSRWNVGCAKKGFWNQTYDYNKVMSLFRVCAAVLAAFDCCGSCMHATQKRRQATVEKWCNVNEFIHLVGHTLRANSYAARDIRILCAKFIHSRATSENLQQFVSVKRRWCCSSSRSRYDTFVPQTRSEFRVCRAHHSYIVS